MTPDEIELVKFIGRFEWGMFTAARRFKVSLCHRRNTAPGKPLSARERHYLRRLAWRRLKKLKMHPLIIPVKEWLAANPQPPTKERERAMKAREREAAREAQAKARAAAKAGGVQMRLL